MTNNKSDIIETGHSRTIDNVAGNSFHSVPILNKSSISTESRN